MTAFSDADFDVSREPLMPTAPRRQRPLRRVRPKGPRPMTPRDYLRSADLDGPATLGLRALAAALETLRARNAETHPAYLSEMTDDPALLHATLPAVVRFACETCREWEADATKATAAAGHGHRDVAQLHRAEADVWHALGYELRRAARVAGVDLSGAP